MKKLAFLLVISALLSGCITIEPGRNPGVVGIAAGVVGGTLGAVGTVLFGDGTRSAPAPQYVANNCVVADNGVQYCVNTTSVVVQPVETATYVYSLPFTPGFGWQSAYYYSRQPYNIFVIGNDGRRHHYQRSGGKWHHR